jgi:pyrroline-5-carboxylate reductase
VTEAELHRAALAGHEALAGIAPFLEMVEGFVAATRRNGFTEEQARAIVAYMFGYRPADGSKPDGAEG